jgi:hypothetical protein
MSIAVFQGEVNRYKLICCFFKIKFETRIPKSETNPNIE